jgi:hypothetical protein
LFCFVFIKKWNVLQSLVLVVIIFSLNCSSLLAISHQLRL